MAATRHFAGRVFTCVQPGLWRSGRVVLREEMRGTREHHDWVAERWGKEDWRAEEVYGIGLSLKEAAATLPHELPNGWRIGDDHPDEDISDVP